MPSNSNLVYALTAMTALTLGLSISFWRASVENKILLQGKLAVDAALEKAQDEKRVLREKVRSETKAREFADTARTVAETSDRAAREKLMQETKAKRAAEAARLGAEAQLETAAAKFAQVAKALNAAEEAQAKTEADLEATNAELAQEREAREAAELRREQAVETVAELTVKLNEEVAARKAVQDALTEKQGQVRVLNEKIAGQIAAGEEAVTMKMAAPSPVAGGKAADEAKGEASNNGSARSEEAPNQMPASIDIGVRETRPAPRPAPLLQANDLSLQELIVQ